MLASVFVMGKEKILLSNKIRSAIICSDEMLGWGFKKVKAWDSKSL